MPLGISRWDDVPLRRAGCPIGIWRYVAPARFTVRKIHRVLAGLLQRPPGAPGLFSTGVEKDVENVENSMWSFITPLRYVKRPSPLLSEKFLEKVKKYP